MESEQVSLPEVLAWDGLLPLQLIIMIIIQIPKVGKLQQSHHWPPSIILITS